jgi:peroxiredoxin
MRRTAILAAILVALTLSLSARADPPTGRSNVGKKIANLTFIDAAGKKLVLHDLKGQKAIVIVFLSFDCPISTSYSQPLTDIHNQLHKYGVTVIGLVPSQDMTPAEVAKKTREYKLPFAVFADKGLLAADALQARITPEVFVLDGGFVLRYRGRIDDAWAARLKENHQAGIQDLQQALGELLTGRRVSNPVTEPIGCEIVRESEPAAKLGPVTYYRDVLPILQKRCQGCHRPGEVGPFSLMTYRQAVNWAQDIKEYSEDRTMPPWKVTAGPAFHNDRRMPASEIAILAAWADGGTPEGDPKDAPPPRQFPHGWQLGQPDLVLTFPDDFQVGPSGKDVFRCFVLPTNLTEDKYVAAVEVRPGNPRIVHHSLLFVDARHQGRKLEANEKARGVVKDPHTGAISLDRGPGYSVSMGVGFTPQGGLSGWAPGAMPRYLPEGFGYFLPKGADVVMQVHYHRDGKLEKDRSAVGLYFAKSDQGKPIQGGTLFGSQGGGPGLFRLYFAIPAGDAHFKLTGTQWAAQDMTLFMVTPHMHLLGKEIRLTLTPPGGAKQTLIEIKDWDYNWQEGYHFKTPVQVKAGSRLDVEAVFDNSENNLRNPFSPPRRVTFGEQTTNEMCFVFLGGTSARPGRRLPLTLEPPGKGTEKRARAR